jgi:hypothetical protein
MRSASSLRVGRNDCSVLKIEAENSSGKLATLRQSENKISRTTEYFINKIRCGRKYRKTGLTPVLNIALFLHTRVTDIRLNTFSISRRLNVVRKEPYDILLKSRQIPSKTQTATNPCQESKLYCRVSKKELTPEGLWHSNENVLCDSQFVVHFLVLQSTLNLATCYNPVPSIHF